MQSLCNKPFILFKSELEDIKITKPNKLLNLTFLICFLNIFSHIDKQNLILHFFLIRTASELLKYFIEKLVVFLTAKQQK